MIFRPGNVPYADWRAIYHGASPSLDDSCRASIAGSAAAVERIVARGEPVYGINTGFGKLASVRIDTADLVTRQRNIVLSHAAGVGDPTPVPVARLMMALKLASLAQGASGVRPATITLLEQMLARGLVSVVPAQGSVGASGDLAPLAHMTSAMTGVGEVIVDGAFTPAAAALAAAGLAPIDLVRRKDWCCSTARSSAPPMPWPRFSRRPDGRGNFDRCGGFTTHRDQGNAMLDPFYRLVS